MTNTREIITKLKEIRDEKGLSYNDIIKIMENKNIYPVSTSTLSRVFSDGSEDLSFNYETTIRPIAEALLDIEEIKEDDDMDVQAMKSLLKYKIKVIEDLEKELKETKALLANEKIKYHEKLDKEREEFKKRTDFLTHQIDLKDKRMDQLLEAVFMKDQKHDELLKLVLSCPARTKCEE